MIISGYEFGNDKPFEKVYFTGMVRDLKRRKMSKSLGNSPDALALLDQYGADGVRVGMLLSAAAGNDLLFDEKLCEQGRNFSNKIWNAFRLIKTWEVKDIPQSDAAKTGGQWFNSRINQVLTELDDLFSKFRLSEALMTSYKLVWDDFCSWYLEMIKPEYGKPIDQTTYNQAIDFLERVMKILHPFMPFISEEIWQNIQVREDNDYLIKAAWPEAKAYDAAYIQKTTEAFEVVTHVRNTRNNKGLSPKESLELMIKTANYSDFKDFIPVIQKLANISDVSETQDKVANATSFIVDKDEFFVPLGENANSEEKKPEEAKSEIQRLEGFIKGIDKKLSNEKFVNNAPEQVVAMERKKKADAEAKIEILKGKLI